MAVESITISQSTNTKANYRPPIFQYINASITTLIFICQGLQLGWPSLMLKELDEHNKITLTTVQYSWVTSIFFLGQACATIIVTVCGNWVGRCTALKITIGCYLASTIYLNFAKSFYELCFVRVLIGLSLECTCSIAIVYIGETTSPSVRGKFLILIPIQVFLGVLIGYIFSAFFTYSIFCASLALIALIELFITFFIIESPYYQILKRCTNEAKITLEKLKFSSNTEQDWLTIKLYIERQTNSKCSFGEMFRKRSYRISLLFGLGYQLIFILAGTDILISYMPTIFQDVNPVSKKYAGIIFMVCIIVASSVATRFVDNWGRRPLLLLSSTLTSLVLIGFGCFYLIQKNQSVSVDKTYTPLVLVVLHSCSAGIGIIALQKICLGELFAVRIAAIATSCCQFFFHGITFIVTNLFPTVSEKYGLEIIFFVFGVLCFIFGLILWYSVIETKNTSLEDIQNKLKQYKIRKDQKAVFTISQGVSQ